MKPTLLKTLVASFVIAVSVLGSSVQARPRDNDPCSNGCVTLHQTADGLVIVTAVDATGAVLATDSKRVDAAVARELYWPAHDLSLPYERVDGQFLALAGMDIGQDTYPLPGGGAATIIHNSGYDLIIITGPDGTVIDVRIQVTTKAR